VRNIFAGFRRWPKALFDFVPAEARLAAISGGPIYLAEDYPFRPGQDSSYYAAASVASRASVSR
jgi:hypothetical protein